MKKVYLDLKIEIVSGTYTVGFKSSYLSLVFAKRMHVAISSDEKNPEDKTSASFGLQASKIFCRL